MLFYHPTKDGAGDEPTLKIKDDRMMQKVTKINIGEQISMGEVQRIGIQSPNKLKRNQRVYGINGVDHQELFKQLKIVSSRRDKEAVVLDCLKGLRFSRVGPRKPLCERRGKAGGRGWGIIRAGVNLHGLPLIGVGIVVALLLYCLLLPSGGTLCFSSQRLGEDGALVTGDWGVVVVEVVVA